MATPLKLFCLGPRFSREGLKSRWKQPCLHNLCTLHRGGGWGGLALVYTARLIACSLWHVLHVEWLRRTVTEETDLKQCQRVNAKVP